MKQAFLLSIIVFFGFITGCRSNKKDVIIKNKNICYDATLKQLQGDSVYKEVMKQFVDTFQIMKNNTEYFGIPEVEKEIDDAIFFNKKKTECLLIVLKRNNYKLVFGTARVIRGELRENQWVFKVSMEYTYSDSYFNLYNENNFKNISTLARYSVLTDGEVKKNGCDVDEEYWFVYMKK